MRHRENKKRFMFYPEDSWVDYWSGFITLVLIFACIVTPYRIAFVEKDALDWIIINGFVDFLFLMDILIIFNTAFYDEDFSTIDCRKQISMQYIQSWFFIDVLSIIPFDLILSASKRSTSMARIMRIGRMYKLVKLTRLLKMLRLVKDRSKILNYVNEVMKIGVGFERLFFFVLLFLLMSHIVSCLWALTAMLEDNLEDTWMSSIADKSSTEKYITSIYFTIETITTVGYGDYGPQTITEKIFCMMTMIIGVISFSFASGSLASILQNVDSQTAAFEHKVEILNRI